MSSESPVALVLINNAISREMARAVLERDRISLSRVVLVTMRKMPLEPWMKQCAEVLEYPVTASLSLLGQRRVIGYYRDASRLVKRVLRSKRLTDIYVINDDNLITNHLFRWAELNKHVRLTVITEGIMNFQDIRARNRAWWRIWTKPVLAKLLGLKWRTPAGHLSGAFQPVCSRVVSFSADGLQAPSEKIVVIPFQPVSPLSPVRNDTLLYIETALWQWMSPEQFAPLAERFADWIKQQGCTRILVKPHPNYPPSDYLRSLLPPFQVWGVGKSVETLAAEIDAAVVVGTCCTGLVTLQMMRPDLRCVDFGADDYLPKAYFGNQDVLNLMRAAGIELVDMHTEPRLPGAKLEHASIS